YLNAADGRAVRVPFLALVYQVREPLLAVAEVLHPQRYLLAADLRRLRDLEVYVHVERDELLEALVHLRHAPREHRRRNDEVLRVGVLGTPPERVLVEPPPQRDLAVDSPRRVVYVDQVLEVDGGVHAA